MYYVCPRDMIVNKIDKVPILMMFEEETDSKVYSHK